MVHAPAFIYAMIPDGILRINITPKAPKVLMVLYLSIKVKISLKKYIL